MHRFHPARLPVPFATLVEVSLVMLLAACGTPKPATPAAVPSVAESTTSAASGTPASAPPQLNLAAEQVRLAELFRGTPVVFAMQQDGSLRATVPLRFSFEAGAVKVKPPLAAVLDRLAKSQAQTTTKMRVAAPADPAARASTIAQDRAASLRDHLVAQGIAAPRVQIGGKAPADQVEIVVSDASR